MKRSDRNKVFDQMDKLNGRKKKPKKLSIPALKRKYEHILRDLVIIRDKNRCQVQGIYNHACEGRLVADHRPVPRSKGNIAFFDPRNLTCVCNKINGMAQNWPAVNEAVCRVVIQREGMAAYQELQDLAKRTNFKLTEDYVLGVIRDFKTALNIPIESSEMTQDERKPR